MFLIIAGLILWTTTHLLRSLAPDLRQQLQNRFGNASKGLIAVMVLLSLVLMIMGYRSAVFTAVWAPPLWMTPINNALMFLALYMYLTTATKPGTAFVFGSLKNPQLTGFKVWAFAHLLVNGDIASILLFGGLLAWAVVQVITSRKVPSLVDRDSAKITSPWIHLGLVIVVFTAISFVHIWLGKWPFGY